MTEKSPAEYKHTLHLPETGFAMKADLAVREPDMIARWNKLDIYARIQEKNKGRPEQGQP